MGCAALMSFDEVQELVVDDAAADAAAAAERKAGWRASLSFRLAWRNLAHDRIRLGATLAGVSFSVILMAIQIALLIGFATTASSLIDRADADFWIANVGARDVDQSGEIPARRRHLVKTIEGVASVEELVVRFVPWQRPDGGSEEVILVGIDLEHQALRPWNMVAGSVEDLRRSKGIILDTLYMEKLGVQALGDVVEINGHRARVVGLTHNVRTFTQAPYVFTALDNAKKFAGIADDRTTYLLVKAQPGADRHQIRQDLQARFPSLDVWGGSSFAWQTSAYWLGSTGAGIALILAAGLGLIVGTITVAQTLYAATMERLSEFATLRAMGAPARYLYGIILRQAMLSAALGYVIGIAVAEAIVYAARDSNVSLALPLWLDVGIALLTFAMCAGAAMISIRRAIKAEPALVFK